MGQRVGTDCAQRIGGNGGDLVPVHALAGDDRATIDASRRGELTYYIERNIFGLAAQPPVDGLCRRTFLCVVAGGIDKPLATDRHADLREPPHRLLRARPTTSRAVRSAKPGVTNNVNGAACRRRIGRANSRLSR